VFAREIVSAWHGEVSDWKDPIFTGERNKKQSNFFFFFLISLVFWLWAVLNFPFSATLSA